MVNQNFASYMYFLFAYNLYLLHHSYNSFHYFQCFQYSWWFTQDNFNLLICSPLMLLVFLISPQISQKLLFFSSMKHTTQIPHYNLNLLLTHFLMVIDYLRRDGRRKLFQETSFHFQIDLSIEHHVGYFEETLL